MLRGTARRPSDHRLGGRGSPLSRFRRMQPIEMKYDVNSEETRRETMQLNAAVEPMFMRARMTVINNEPITALRGISSPTEAETCKRYI